MAKKTVKKKQKQNNISAFIELIKKERTRFLLGVCLAFIGVFIFLGEISFLFTGAADQGKVVYESFTGLIAQKSEISNWTGVAGAFISEKLINQWFGVFSLLIPVYLIAMGLKMMRVINVSAIRWFLLTAFAIIWGSITSEFILKRILPESHIVWGGRHGQTIEQILENSLGIPGMIMVILLLFIIFMVITKKASMNFFRNLFRNPLKKREPEEDDGQFDLEFEEEKKESIFSKIKNLLFPSKEESDEDDINIKNPEPEISQPIDLYNTNTSAKPQKPLEVDDDFEIVVPEDDEYTAAKPITNNTEAGDDNNAETTDLPDDEMEEYDPTKDLSHFAFPSTELPKI